jgi:hypothetical protein
MLMEVEMSEGFCVSRPSDRGKEAHVLGSLLDCGVHSSRGTCRLFEALEEVDVLHINKS